MRCLRMLGNEIRERGSRNSDWDPDTEAVGSLVGFLCQDSNEMYFVCDAPCYRLSQAGGGTRFAPKNTLMPLLSALWQNQRSDHGIL